MAKKERERCTKRDRERETQHLQILLFNALLSRIRNIFAMRCTVCILPHSLWQISYIWFCQHFNLPYLFMIFDVLTFYPTTFNWCAQPQAARRRICISMCALFMCTAPQKLSDRQVTNKWRSQLKLRLEMKLLHKTEGQTALSCSNSVYSAASMLERERSRESEGEVQA